MVTSGTPSGVTHEEPMVKWSLISIGLVLILLVGGFLWLVVDFGGHEKTHLISQSESPDGNFVVEVHEVTTPMHGGPDSVQVTLRSTTAAVGDVVYSQNFECGPDYSAFQVEWQSSKNLIVQSGICDAGRYNSASSNKVLRKIMSWEGVSIVYRESDHVAHAKL